MFFCLLVCVCTVQCNDCSQEDTENTVVSDAVDSVVPFPDFGFGDASDTADEASDTEDEAVPDLIADLPPDDVHLEVTDASDPPEPLDCPLQFEECLQLIPGCYEEPCPDFEGCPLTGCDSDPPDVEYLLHGSDYCGDFWIELGDPTGRLEARDAEMTTPYGGGAFSAYLDGELMTTCEYVGLPTGAIRYQMTCSDSAGQIVHASVLEVGENCPCPDLSGCYAVEAEQIICDPGPCPPTIDLLRIEQTSSCRVWVVVDEARIFTASGWVSMDGTLTLDMRYADSPFNVCSLINDGGALGPAICHVGTGDDAAIVPIDVTLTPTGDDSCDLPECISDESCQRASLGETCVDGSCQ